MTAPDLPQHHLAIARDALADLAPDNATDLIMFAQAHTMIGILADLIGTVDTDEVFTDIEPPEAP